MRKPAICVQNYNEGVTIEETAHAIKKAGFRDVYVQWYDDRKLEMKQKEQVKMCRDLGLNIIFAHLGYKDINDIWKKGVEGDKVSRRLKKNLREARVNHIDRVIIHLEHGGLEIPYEESEWGLERLRWVTEYARKLNLMVAFENTAKSEYLRWQFYDYREYNVGFCLDIGHFNVYDKQKYFLNIDDAFCKIHAVNFHDNKGRKDTHLLPFDGNIKWRPITEWLKEVRYKGPVTMNPVYRGDYLKKLTLDQFYLEAFKRGQKIAEIFGDQNYG